VLADPSLLGPDGLLPQQGDAASPAAAAESGESLWEGTLVVDGTGGYRLEGSSGDWPLITLEPAMHRWLLLQERPRPVRLVACANPWGPWLRVSRLADGP
jgi:hypothetical protein